jgi:hypothetical protein
VVKTSSGAFWDAAARQRRAVRKVQEMAITLSWSPDAEHIAVKGVAAIMI